MGNEQIESFSEKTRELIDRAVCLNATLFSQFSKAAKLQMDSFQSYTNIAMEQSRQATHAWSTNDLKALPETQAHTLESLNAQVSKDWQAWQDYMAEARDQLKAAFAEKAISQLDEKTANFATSRQDKKAKSEAA